MLKTHAAWPVADDGRLATLHAVGAALPQQGLAATKTWAHTPAGSQPLVLLFDARTGSLRAVIEAFLLGQLRTAAVSALATDVLAPPDARVGAVVGTGRQALPQMAALVCVRPLTELVLVSRDRARAAELASRAERVLGLPVRGSDSVADCAAADVVTLATRAVQPVVGLDALHPHAHVNAIGAITPERAEVGVDVVRSCSVVVADSRAQARALSRELRAAFGEVEDRWSTVQELAEVVQPGWNGRGEGRTLFKAMGVGLADLAVAAACLDAAEAAGRGHELPDRPAEPDLHDEPFRAHPRLARS